MNPNNETKQIISLFQYKVAALTTTINSLHMCTCDTILGYAVYWWTSIKHMAPAHNLSQQSDALMQFHRSLIPRIKVNINFPVALIPIYPAFGGLVFRTLELEQGLESTSHLISLWDTETSASNLLRVILEYLQLEVGSTDLALNKSFSLCGHLATPGWLSSAWEFLDFYNLEITIPSLKFPNHSSANDSAII